MRKILPEIVSKDDLPFLFNLMGYSGKGAEIGVQQGIHSAYLRRHWIGGTLYLVDRWQHVEGYADTANVAQHIHDEYYRQTIAAFEGRNDVCILRGDSVLAAQDFLDDSFDWIFLDADHSSQGVAADLAAWTPKVRKGGIIAGHDYIDGIFYGTEFGVKTAVDQWAHEHDFFINETCDPFCPSWYCLKS